MLKSTCLLRHSCLLLIATKLFGTQGAQKSLVLTSIGQGNFWRGSPYFGDPSPSMFHCWWAGIMKKVGGNAYLPPTIHGNTAHFFTFSVGQTGMTCISNPLFKSFPPLVNQRIFPHLIPLHNIPPLTCSITCHGLINLTLIFYGYG